MNLNYLKQISKQNNESKFLLNRRIKAFEQFKKLEVPNFKYGLTIRLNLDLNLDEIKLEENGSYDLKGKDEIIKKYFMKFSLNDKFRAMHAAFYNKVNLIHIPKNSKKQIKLESNLKNNRFENYLIIVDENSELNIIDNLSSKKEVFNSHIVEIYIKDNSKVNYVEVQGLDEESYNFTYKIANLAKDSKMNWFELCLGSKFTRTETTTILNGEGAEVKTYGVFFGSGEQQFDMVSKTIHNNRNTISDMFTKGVLNDKAKGVYRGSIRIEKNAFNSNGYQKEDTLLLSDEAEADSIPSLEIENHDVKCSHGSTIGQIDKEQLFYLMSRGLNKKEANKMIVNGFFQPLIDKVDENLQKSIMNMVEVKLK